MESAGALWPSVNTYTRCVVHEGCYDYTQQISIIQVNISATKKRAQRDIKQCTHTVSMAITIVYGNTTV